MTRRRWLRAGLAVLAFANGAAGAWAAVASRSFFDGLPLPGHPWVALLPPYNGHLVFDVGVLLLALAVPLAVAAVALEPLLVRTALAAFLVFAAPHFLFHVTHLGGFPIADAIAQTAATALLVLVAVALLVASPPLNAPRRREHP